MAKKNRVVDTVLKTAQVKSSLSNFLGADVGFLKETTGPVVYPDTNDWTVASNAAHHEHGDPAHGTPARPFMRGGADRFEKDEHAVGGVIDRLVQGQIDPRTASNQLGTLMQGHIQSSIREGPWAPLDPETIRRKGSSKPLIDSGLLRQSVDVRTK